MRDRMLDYIPSWLAPLACTIAAAAAIWVHLAEILL